MRNFLFGILVALFVSTFAETPHEDGSVTYTKDENLAIYGTLQEMSGEISRLVGEVNKANYVFVAMNRKIEELNKRTCI